MLSPHIRRRGAAGAGAVLAVVATGFAIASTGMTADPPPEGAPVPPSVMPMVTAVPPDQRAAYHVLDGPPRRSVAMRVARPGPFGTNPALARSVSSPEGDVEVLPGNGSVCLRADDAVGATYACGPSEVAQDSVLMLGLHDQGDDSLTVYGLVPDDAGPVTLTTPDGEEELDVEDNVFSAELDSAAGASVQLDGDPLSYPVP